MSRKKDVTLQDLAARLGLTIHTVSKALRGKPGMSEETRRKVFRTAREMGYRTRAQEEALLVDRLVPLSHKSHRFVFVSGWSDDVTNRLYSAIQDRLLEFGHQLNFTLFPGNITRPIDIREWIERMGLSYASGIFIAPGLQPVLEKQLLELSLPKIMLNYPEPGMHADSIIWDVNDAIAQSVHVLAEAGHSRILYLGDIDAQRGFRQRWQAFGEALKSIGIAHSAEELLLQPVGTQEQWTLAFAEKWEKLRPTAILCAIEYLLPWIYYTCSRLGLTIPDDVSLVNLETAETSFLTELTRPELPVRETGTRAADRMLWRLANPHLPFEHSRLQCRWYAGNTVRRLGSPK